MVKSGSPLTTLVDTDCAEEDGAAKTARTEAIAIAAARLSQIVRIMCTSKKE
jgi:hypothetical protein